MQSCFEAYNCLCNSHDPDPTTPLLACRLCHFVIVQGSRHYFNSWKAESRVRLHSFGHQFWQL